MHAGLVNTSLRVLTGCCLVLLAVLSLLPAEEMVRTGLPGRFEHFVAYAGSAALDLALPRGGLDRGSRPWPVRCRVMEAQEIWFGPRRRCGDPGNRPVTQYVRDVACSLDRDLALVEVMFAAIADMSVVPGVSAYHSKKLVVAALQGAVTRQISEMPFPDKRGAITGAAQQ